MNPTDVLTTGIIARRYGVAAWKVRRLWESGLMPPAPRLGMYRIVRVADLPAVEAALRKAGYLPAEAAHAS
jgi:hypothetical protein